MRGVEELAPYMARVQEKELFLAALRAFRDVNVLVFGTELGECWRESLHSLRVALGALHSSTVCLPITPKYHILMEPGLPPGLIYQLFSMVNFYFKYAQMVQKIQNNIKRGPKIQKTKLKIGKQG